jgi:hypothetical protein
MDRRVDVLAQYRLDGIDITGEQVFHSLLQQDLVIHGMLPVSAVQSALTGTDY